MDFYLSRQRIKLHRYGKGRVESAQKRRQVRFGSGGALHSDLSGLFGQTGLGLSP
jgi:hypothetical protein